MENLWSDFENEASLREGVGQGARYRRLSEAAVLFALREWLLRDYVAAYGRSLGATRIFRRCYWIDSLGGSRPVGSGERNGEPGPVEEKVARVQENRRGRREERGKARAVPPVLQPVIDVARILACEERPITLQGIVLEGGSGKRKSGRTGQEKGRQAEQAAKPFVLPKESSLARASWLEIAPSLLPALEQTAAIFLLTPFKDAIFTYDDLAPLYTRTAPTELCFFVSYRHMQKRLLPALRTSAGAAAFTALLRSDRWKKLLPKEGEGGKEGEGMQEARIVEGLLDAFMDSMRPHFLTVQRLGVPVLAGPALVEEAPYVLIFATRRQDSLMSMNDAACLYKRRLDEESHRGVLTEDWFVAQRQERAEEQMRWLCQRVLQLGSARRIRRWPDLRQQLLIAHFGQYTVRDYDEAIDTLLRRGEVRCEWRRRAGENGEQEERRVPGHDDALLWK